MSSDKTRKIRALNDDLRRTFTGGRVMMTVGVKALPPDTRAHVCQAVQGFTSFDADNDPHGEHDFGSVEVDGQKFFWKIDYFDKALEYGSEDPSDPEQTTRIMTIMTVREY